MSLIQKNESWANIILSIKDGGFLPSGEVHIRYSVMVVAAVLRIVRGLNFESLALYVVNTVRVVTDETRHGRFLYFF